MIEYNIVNFGAKGDGITDNSSCIQTAIDACRKNGGGKIVVPSGMTFLSGPFDLCSNLELNIQPGACLLASPDESNYKKSAFRKNQSEGSIWIGGENLENVLITGGGTIDGNGISFMGAEHHDAYELKPFEKIDPRPHLLTLVNGAKIKINNITFKDAAYWCLHFAGCQDVLISNVSIYNDLKIRNGDGIDLDHCKNVNITNCHIESGDDCICFKNRREYAEFGPCKDITVSNCTLVSTSCAIKFGSENMDVIENVVISNCIIKDSNRGIGIQNRDEGSISNILVSNIIMHCRLFSDVWWGKSEPIYITAYPRANTNHKDAGQRLPEGATEGVVGKIENITFSNIMCRSENGIFIGASDQCKVDNIILRDIDLLINKETKFKGGIYDCRPNSDIALIEDGTYGFYLKNAKNISISNSKLRWGDNCPDYFRGPIKKVNCKEIHLSGCELGDTLSSSSSFSKVGSIN